MFVAGPEGLEEVVGDDRSHAPDVIRLREVERQGVPDGIRRLATKLRVSLDIGIVELLDGHEHYRFDFAGAELEIIRRDGTLELPQYGNYRSDT